VGPAVRRWYSSHSVTLLHQPMRDVYVNGPVQGLHTSYCVQICRALRSRSTPPAVTNAHHAHPWAVGHPMQLYLNAVYLGHCPSLQNACPGRLPQSCANQRSHHWFGPTSPFTPGRVNASRVNVSRVNVNCVNVSRVSVSRRCSSTLLPPPLPHPLQTRRRPPRSPSRGRRGPRALRRTRPPPCPRRHTSGRRRAWHT